MNLSDFAQDVDAKKNGLWEKIGEMKFLISHAHNKKWKAEYKSLQNKEYGKKLEKPNFKGDQDKDIQMMFRCLAKFGILGWENLLDPKTKEEIEYSVETSVELFTSERFQPLTEKLLEFAVDQDRFMENQIQKDEDTAGE